MRIIRIVTRAVIAVSFAALVIAAIKGPLLSEISQFPPLVARVLALSFVVDTLLLRWIYGRGTKACLIASFFMNLFAAPLAVFSAGPLHYYLRPMLSHQVPDIWGFTVTICPWYEGALVLLLAAAIKTLVQSVALHLEFAERIRLREAALFLAMELIVMGIVLHRLWSPLPLIHDP